MTIMIIVMISKNFTLNHYFSNAQLFLESHFKIHYLLAMPMTAAPHAINHSFS